MATKLISVPAGSSGIILVRAIQSTPNGVFYSDFASIPYQDAGTGANGGNRGTINASTDILMSGGSLYAGQFDGSTGLIDPLTASVSGSGVILNQYGISGYAGGNKKFYIDSRTGNAFFSGDITGSTGTFSGSITAASGTIGGWTINSSTLTGGNATLNSAGSISIGTGSSIFKADNYGIYLGNATFASAPFSVTPGGTLKATSGTIGGWSIQTTNLKSTNNAVTLDASQGQISVTDPNNVNSGVYLVAGNGTPKLYIGSGNFGTMATGFYADGAGYFSLGNQLTFTPASAAVSQAFTATVGQDSPNLILAASNTFIKVGMAITGTGIQSGSSVVSVSGTNVVMSKNALSTQISAPVTFYQDNFSELNVTGRITGVINSVTPILLPRLATGITQIVVSGTSPNQTATVTTTGHAYLVTEKVLIEGFTTTGGLNNLNRPFALASVTDSVTFTLDLSGITGVTSGTYSSLSNVLASLQEVTMGLHPAEGVSGTDSFYHSTATGLRQDKYNWWFTNTQFRVGNALTYLKYDGTSLRIKGGSSKYVSLNVGGTDAQNNIAITSDVTSGVPNPSFSSANTPFYVNGQGKFSLGTYVSFDPTLTNPLFIIGGTGSTYSLKIQTGNLAANNLLSIYTTSGTPTYNNANTPFYVDGTGQFSLGSKLYFDGTNLTATGSITANAFATGSDYWNSDTSFQLGGTNGIKKGTTGSVTIGTNVTISADLTLGTDYWKQDGSFRLGGSTGITKGTTGGITIGSNVTISALSSYAQQSSLDTTNSNVTNVTNKTSNYNTTGNISGGISLTTSGSIAAGKTAYTDDANVGWFIGYRTVSAGVYTPAFNFGGSTKYIKWDGASLTISGTITGSSFTSTQGGISIGQSGSYDYLTFTSGASTSTMAFTASGMLWSGPATSSTYSQVLQMTTGGSTKLSSPGNEINITNGGLIYLSASSSANSSALRNSSIISVASATSLGISNGSTSTSGYAVGDMVFTY